MDYQDVFARSWDLVEQSYRGKNFEPVAELVREMRRRGYDRAFRAGMSLYSLVLSRSAEHGLRPDQPFVEVFVWPGQQDGPMRVSSGPGEGRSFVEQGFAFTPALERALEDLARAPID